MAKREVLRELPAHAETEEDRPLRVDGVGDREDRLVDPVERPVAVAGRRLAVAAQVE